MSIEHHLSATVDAGIVAERCKCDRSLGSRLEYISFVNLAYTIKDQIACARHAAANKKDLGIKAGAKQTERTSEYGAAAVDRHGCQFVTCCAGVTDFLCRKVVENV